MKTENKSPRTKHQSILKSSLFLCWPQHAAGLVPCRPWGQSCRGLELETSWPPPPVSPRYVSGGELLPYSSQLSLVQFPTQNTHTLCSGAARDEVRLQPSCDAGFGPTSRRHRNTTLLQCRSTRWCRAPWLGPCKGVGEVLRLSLEHCWPFCSCKASRKPLCSCPSSCRQ